MEGRNPLDPPMRPVAGAPDLQNIRSFTPSIVAEDVQPGETVSERLTGRSGSRFGIQRFLPGGPALQQFRVTLRIGREVTLLRDCRLEALAELYRQRLMHSPVIIPEGSYLHVELENTGTSAALATLATPGLTAPTLEVYEGRRQKAGYGLLAPRFFHVSGEVGAGAQMQTEVETGADPAVMHRLAFDTEAADTMLATLYRLNDRLFGGLTKRQVTRRYLNGPQAVPNKVGRRTPLRLTMENKGSTSAKFSFIAEAYYRS